MFLLVFGLSEGATYGWLTPTRDFDPVARRSGRRPGRCRSSRSCSPSAVLLGSFVVFERRKERATRDPLFEFGAAAHPPFRYGLMTAVIVAMGQFGLLFVLPVFLQDGKHLSAMTCGLWMVVPGIFVIVGAQAGGRLTRRVGTTRVVQGALAIEALGLVLSAAVVSADVTLLQLLPGFILYGCGVGAASAQLTNVILADTPADKAGVASGANSTVRQVGLGARRRGHRLDPVGGHHPSRHRPARLVGGRPRAAVPGGRAAPHRGHQLRRTTGHELDRSGAPALDAVGRHRHRCPSGAAVRRGGRRGGDGRVAADPPDRPAGPPPDPHEEIDAFEAFEPLDPEGCLPTATRPSTSGPSTLSRRWPRPTSGRPRARAGGPAVGGDHLEAGPAAVAGGIPPALVGRPRPGPRRRPSAPTPRRPTASRAGGRAGQRPDRSTAHRRAGAVDHLDRRRGSGCTIAGAGAGQPTGPRRGDRSRAGPPAGRPVRSTACGRHQGDLLGRAPAAPPLGHGDRVGAEQALHPGHGPAGPLVGRGLAAPEPELATGGGHDLVGHQAQQGDAAGGAVGGRTVAASRRAASGPGRRGARR